MAYNRFPPMSIFRFFAFGKWMQKKFIYTANRIAGITMNSHHLSISSGKSDGENSAWMSCKQQQYCPMDLHFDDLRRIVVGGDLWPHMY